MFDNGDEMVDAMTVAFLLTAIAIGGCAFVAYMVANP